MNFFSIYFLSVFIPFLIRINEIFTILKQHCLFVFLNSMQILFAVQKAVEKASSPFTRGPHY